MEIVELSFTARYRLNSFEKKYIPPTKYDWNGYIDAMKIYRNFN